MSKDQHFSSLESMYHAAPINDFVPPRINVSEGECTIEIDVKKEYFHAAGAVHGSIYFKILDDAAFFAANSYEREVFVLTTSFTTYITRPTSEGIMRAVGRVVNKNKTQFIAESVVYDAEGREIARGNGIFVRSKMALKDVSGYEG